MAEEVVVMYHGEVMERGIGRRRSSRSRGHPYLQALLRAVPRLTCAPGERLEPVREIKRRRPVR